MSLHEVLEMIYYVSGPLIVAVGVIGLTQIIIAKRDISIRTKREAVTVAALQCQQYNEKIVPLLNEFYIYRKKSNLEEFKGADMGFDLKDIMGANPNWCKTVFEKLKGDDDFAVRLVSIMNALESFSIFFTERVADEEVAFSSVGLTFCDTVKKMSPFFAIVRDHYANVIRLYKIWSSRIEKKKLASQVGDLYERMTSICDDNIRPLGTDGKDK